MNNKVIKSILMLASGTIIAQVISFIASPIMTRLYSAETIGEYTIIFTAIGMFGSIINGRYDMSIVTEPDQNKVYSLIKLCIIIAFFSSLIISIVYTVYIKFTNPFMNLILLFCILFVLLFTVGISNVLLSYNNRMKEYKLMSKVMIIQTMTKEVLVLIFGFTNLTTLGLITSQFIGQIVGLREQAKSLINDFPRIVRINKKELKSVAKKYSGQPLYSMPALFANSFSYSSINLFIQFLFGTSTLGFYSISYRVLGIPLALISNNVSKVYYKEASQVYSENKNYNKLFLDTTKILILISLIMVTSLMLIAPNLFSFFFGAEWRIAGEYVQILAPMFGIRLIVSPLTPGVIINNKQKLEFYVQLLFIIVSCFIFTLTFYFNYSVKMYITLISIGYSIVYLVYFIILYRLSIDKSELIEK